MSDYRNRINMYSIRQDQINNTHRHQRRMRMHNDLILYNDFINNVMPEVTNVRTRRNALTINTNTSGTNWGDTSGTNWRDTSGTNWGNTSDTNWGGNVPVPTSLKDLTMSSKLDLYSLDVKYKYPETSCLICLKEFEEADIIRILKCEHKYCHGCIDMWLLSNHKCPVCKFDLVNAIEPEIPQRRSSLVHTPDIDNPLTPPLNPNPPQIDILEPLNRMLASPIVDPVLNPQNPLESLDIFLQNMMRDFLES